MAVVALDLNGGPEFIPGFVGLIATAPKSDALLDRRHRFGARAPVILPSTQIS